MFSALHVDWKKIEATAALVMHSLQNLPQPITRWSASIPLLTSVGYIGILVSRSVPMGEPSAQIWYCELECRIPTSASGKLFRFLEGKRKLEATEIISQLRSWLSLNNHILQLSLSEQGEEILYNDITRSLA